MNPPTSALRRLPPLALALALCAAIAAPALLAGAADAAYQSESLGEYEAQLHTGQIRDATINKKIRTIRITLKDGRLMLAKYPPHNEPVVLKALQARHVPVTVLTPAQANKEAAKRPVHHKIRYIVGGVVIALAVVAIAVYLYNRRQQRD